MRWLVTIGKVLHLHRKAPWWTPSTAPWRRTARTCSTAQSISFWVKVPWSTCIALLIVSVSRSWSSCGFLNVFRCLAGNNLSTSPHSQDNFGVSSTNNYSSLEDCRFQYVLAAATSIATKQNEDTLTYLNQGQSYEVKLKKLGDLSMYRGKLLKVTFNKLCFVNSPWCV